MCLLKQFVVNKTFLPFVTTAFCRLMYLKRSRCAAACLCLYQNLENGNKVWSTINEVEQKARSTTISVPPYIVN
jgi:hypothetical protein